MSKLLIELSRRNRFESFISAPNGIKKIKQSDKEIRNYAINLLSVRTAASFVEHENWLNFTKYGLPKPIYINLIRDPIQKVMSGYYYIRKLETFSVYFFNNVNLKMKDPAYFKTSFNQCLREGISPFCNFNKNVKYNDDWRRFCMHFCGHAAICRQFNSPAASQIAKRNIEEEYAVVGSWEDTNVTLTVLENYVPRFFRGATEIFYSDPKNFHINSTPHKTQLDPDIEAKLRIQFAFEIDLYNFAKQRLYKQYIAIRKRKVQLQFG